MLTVGLDIGNATTEAVLADVDDAGVRVLGWDRLPTRGPKGSPASLDGAVRLVRRLERAHRVRVEMVVVAPLRPVSTLTATLPEPSADTGRLTLIRAGSDTAAGHGAAHGPPHLIGASSSAARAVIAVVPQAVGYAQALPELTALARDGLLAGVVLARDEAVLLANRLPASAQAIPVVDEVATEQVLAAELLAVEVRPPGQPLRLLTDPLRLGAELGLSPADRPGAVRLAALLYDRSNAVVALHTTAPASVPTATPGDAWVTVSPATSSGGSAPASSATEATASEATASATGASRAAASGAALGGGGGDRLPLLQAHAALRAGPPGWARSYRLPDNAGQRADVGSNTDQPADANSDPPATEQPDHADAKAGLPKGEGGTGQLMNATSGQAGDTDGSALGQGDAGQDDAGPGEALVRPVDDLYTVDLAALSDAVLARAGALSSRTLVLAALHADTPYTDPAAELAGRLGVPVRTASSEALAARLGGLSTPGAGEHAVVVDLGGGTIDVVTEAGAVIVAGAGELLTAATAALIGTGRAAAEWAKRGPGYRVEGPQVLLGEDGSRTFLDRPVGPDAVGALVTAGPAGWLPFDRAHAPSEWRALRLRLKSDVLGDNVARALRALAVVPPEVVVVGGPAEDDEVLACVARALPPGTAVGRGNAAGMLGHRHVVAYGLLLT